MDRRKCSIIFLTANGSKIEVTRTQMEKVHNILWKDTDKEDNQTNNIDKSFTFEVGNDKENEPIEDYFFDDTKDDIYGELLFPTDKKMATQFTRKRMGELIESNPINVKKMRQNDSI